VRTGPHGDIVLVLDVTAPDTGVRTIDVHVYRGNTIITAGMSNGKPADLTASPQQAKSTNDSATGRAELPLGIDDLVNLADVPELQLVPGEPLAEPRSAGQMACELMLKIDGVRFRVAVTRKRTCLQSEEDVALSTRRR
jgi:hypothetical protein